MPASQTGTSSRPATFSEFLTRHFWTDDDGGTRITPWRVQCELAEAIPRIKRAVILKARQLGVTWEFAGYSAYIGSEQGAKVLLFSQTLPDAQDFKAKVQFTYDRLPGWKPAIGRHNLSLLTFPHARSFIRARAANEHAGRGVSRARLAVLDEFAMQQWGGKVLTAAMPATEAGGQLFAVSTANGIGNDFHALWQGATEARGYAVPYKDGGEWTFGTRLQDAIANTPEKSFVAIFMPWFIHPDRSEAWYEAEKEAYRQRGKLHEFYQEFPGEPEEAFVQTGRPVFAKEYLDKLRAGVRQPLPKEQWPQPFRDGVRWDKGFSHFRPDELRVFSLPELQHRYYAAADVAEGLEHGDYDDLAVFDAEGDREVLSLHGHWPPDVFARLIDCVGRQYPGMYAVERNNHGHAVLTVLKMVYDASCPYVLYRQMQEFDRRTSSDYQEARLGWVTSGVTKPMAIDKLEEAIRLGGIHLSDELAWPELTFYRTEAGGRTSAPSGMYDDRVMSRAIAWQMRKHRKRQLKVF